MTQTARKPTGRRRGRPPGSRNRKPAPPAVSADEARALPLLEQIVKGLDEEIERLTRARDGVKEAMRS